MGWTNAARPGCEGHIVAIVEGPAGVFVEVRSGSRRPIASVAWASAACTCGWRSERVRAPSGVAYFPCSVDAPEWFTATLAGRWEVHIEVAELVRAIDVRTRLLAKGLQ